MYTTAKTVKCRAPLICSDFIRYQPDLNGSDTHLDKETSEAIDRRWFSHRQIQYGTEKVNYLLYQELRKSRAYALPPTPPMFIMETNCLLSLFRSCDTACADFRGNNK